MGRNETNLTEGSIPKKLIVYSLPLILSGVLQALYGIADMVVAGRFIGAAGMSGITNSSQVMNMVTQILIGLTMGGNILIGQYFGAGERSDTHKSVSTLIGGSLIAGTVLAALVWFIAGPLLTLLDAPALSEAVAYLQICAIGIPFIFGYNAAAAALRGVGNSRVPLICVAATCALNVVLDVLFVGVWHMGTTGAAVATVVSQALCFVMSLLFMLRAPETFGMGVGRFHFYRDKAAAVLKLGVPCAVQMSIAAISWLVVAYFINSYGVAVSAGFGVAAKIKDFCRLFTASMSNAATSMIAQNIGARQYDRAKRVMYTGMGITVGLALVFIALVELSAPALAGLFTSDTATIAAAVQNLRYEIIGEVFYASFFIYHSLALGAGHSWFVFFSSFVNCILARLVLVLVLEPVMGLDGIYLALMIAPATSVPIGLWYERSNRWRRGLLP